MSRTTLHEFMEVACNEALTADVKDKYCNKARAVVFADLQPWGAYHIQTNETTETKDSVEAVANTQTEYAYPSTAVPMEIKQITVRRSTSSPYYTARCVAPFEFGDNIAQDYTNSTHPVYFVRNNKYVVYPQFDSIVTAAINVYLIDSTNELSDSVTATNMTKEGERLWAIKAAQKYYEAINEQKRAQAMLNDYEEYKWSLRKLSPLPSIQ